MNPTLRTILSGIFLFSMLGTALLAAEPPLREEADRHFRHARRLIQENCKGCDSLDEDTLKQGLFEMRQAMAMKCADADEARQLMADGYRTLLSVFVTPGSPELDQLVPELARIYDELIERHPSDVNMLFERAKLYRDKGEKMAGFRRVLKADPDHAPARFAVAYLLLEGGKTSEGLAEYSRVRPTPVKAELYRNTVAALLRLQGHTKEAELARQQTFTSPRYAARATN